MTNRLKGSVSPYLCQHASDPVDWFPWGDEAFETARRLDKPVLLSCGYSACHWCHVMQRESFRDEDTARLINDTCVAVKVDRELRPDVDALYQDYVAASTGSGGWPLTAWLTADRLPVFGGTYFPLRPPAGLIGFTDALEGVATAWRDERADVEKTAAHSLEFLLRAAAAPTGPIDRAMLDVAAEAVLNLQDPVHGGLKGSMKFPQLPTIEFLCAYARIVRDSELLRAIERTMLAIVRGGIYDHVGGGVHRYATDAQWRTPHFEKMLYDQGLLLSALATAAPLASTGAVRDEYAHAARSTAAFMTREMALPAGGFAASLSADTGGVEGTTYTWTRAQLEEALDADGVALCERELGAEPEGSLRAVTLHRPGGRTGDAAVVDSVLAKLAQARALRPQPDVDGKTLTAWNAIAAKGLIEAGTEFGDAVMVEAGVKAALYLDATAAMPTGVLREPNDPSVASVRLLEDAAHLVAALLACADATGDGAVRERAAALHADTLARFADGPVLYAVPDDTDLPLRIREGGDGAMPSGASTTILNAVRLGRATGDESYLDFAESALEQMWSMVDFAPEQTGRTLAVAVELELLGA